MAAIYPSDVGSPLPATRAFTAKSAKCPAAPMSNGNTRSLEHAVKKPSFPSPRKSYSE